MYGLHFTGCAVKKFSSFPVPSRDIAPAGNNLIIPGQEEFDK
jgi:hypothetical protein